MKKSIIRFKYWIIALIMMVISGAGAKASAPWAVNPNEFRYDMSLYLDVTIDSEKMDYSKYEVAAFCGNECRGVAEPLALSNGKVCLYLRVRSNVESDEDITFRYYDSETEKTYAIPGVSIKFESNGLIGYPSDPFLINIVNVKYYDLTLSAGPGGSIDLESGAFAEGSELIVTATPEEGYSFEKWSDGLTDNPRTLTIKEDLTLTAEFTVNSYVLVYMIDGETYKEYTVDYGTELKAEAEPEKEGHTFYGWEGLPATMPAHDVTVSGTFTVNSYMLTYLVDGEIYKELTVEYGAAVTAEAAPEKEGYTFSGWEGVPATMPAHDVTVSGSFSIKVIDVTGVTLNATELSLTEGDTANLTATVAPIDASDKTVTWTTSDEAVATVDANGTVTAVKAGTATITATSANGKTASCTVTVLPILIETLTIDPTVWNGEEGSEFTITATVLPEDATGKTLVWSSSDETVAAVDSEGNVKVLKEGICVITVATTDGSDLTAQCEITSVAGVEGIFGDDALVDVYDMNGVLVKKGCGRNELELLTPGIYILRSGDKVVKVVIR